MNEYIATFDRSSK